MNIVIPMAGRGNRFSGFDLPKPLIKINNISMVEHSIRSLDIEGNYIFITRKYKNGHFNNQLNNILNSTSPNCKIIEIDYLTEGAASSALLSKSFINNDDPLIITNCDRITNWNSEDFLKKCNEYDVDGLVTTWDKISNTESFIEIDEFGYGKRLVEKEIISKYPLNGIHYWKHGRYFVESAEKMIKKNIRINNEYYISMTYNEMINDGYKIKNYKMGKNEHFSVGDPYDLKKYLEWKKLN